MRICDATSEFWSKREIERYLAPVPGYRPLHRMASNNLAIGASALLKAGADPRAKTESGEDAMSIARASRARDVMAVLSKYL